MNQNEQNVTFDRIIKCLSVLLVIGGAVDVLVGSINGKSFSFSAVSIVLFCLAIILCVFSNSNTRYCLKRWFLYYIRQSDPYIILRKEIRYTYDSIDHMQHKKKYYIKSKSSKLDCLCDKFAWSSHQKLEDMDIVFGDDATGIETRRVETWNRYELRFPPIGKGMKITVSMNISNLFDQEKEALPFLSTGITCKTKMFRMTVIFNDPKLIPRNIKYRRYDAYATDYPCYECSLSYDSDDHKIEVTELHPIYGYRYKISWDF